MYKNKKYFSCFEKFNFELALNQMKGNKNVNIIKIKSPHFVIMLNMNVKSR